MTHIKMLVELADEYSVQLLSIKETTTEITIIFNNRKGDKKTLVLAKDSSESPIEQRARQFIDIHKE